MNLDTFLQQQEEKNTKRLHVLLLDPEKGMDDLVKLIKSIVVDTILISGDEESTGYTQKEIKS